MQALMETIFDVLYLSGVVILGIIMMIRGKNDSQSRLFGIMAVTLGLGDAFHLIPRAYALNTTGLDQHVEILGIGKMITSLTMTVFYILLYHIWRKRYQVTGKTWLTITFYGLALARVILTLLPQNAWTSANPPLSFAIYRNIPFAIIGLIIIWLFYTSAKQTNDRAYRHMWLTIVLSFAFYLPVVLWGDVYPLIGMLMIPKTLAYVWTVLIGYFDMKERIA